MDDETLPCRIGQRDEEGFRLLYARHSPRVYGLLCRLAGQDEARELLQETWLRALRHLPLYRGQCAFCSWLTGIALNCYREHRRRHSRGADPDAVAAPPAPAAGEDEVTQVSVTLAALLPEQREVLVLHDIEGFSHDEIAAALEIDAATSRSRLSRARRTFRQRWLEARP